MKLTANVPGFDPEILGDMAGFPGMEEYFGMEMIYTLMTDASYDVVVFDTAPTGHTFEDANCPRCHSCFHPPYFTNEGQNRKLERFCFPQEIPNGKGRERIRGNM